MEQHDGDDFINFNDDDYVDFDDVQIEKKGYKINYSSETDYYKKMREMCLDPITCEQVKDGFNYPYMWDPYNGIKLDILDPYGPLCFDPCALIYSIYTSRLKFLWHPETTQPNGEIFQGYYDGCVGTGEEMIIKSRGSQKHLYPFRLPIIDCYLPEDSDMSITTMGPKLTLEEIKKIDELANKQSNRYIRIYKEKLPSLEKMQYYYDRALGLYNTTHDMQIQAVEKLKQM